MASWGLTFKTGERVRDRKEKGRKKREARRAREREISNYMLGCQGGLPGPNDGHSWTWVGNCSNPMRIAANRGVGGTTGKFGNVQLCVFESQIRTRGAGRRSILICSKQSPGLLDSLSERPSECHQHLHAAVGRAALYMRSRQVMSCADNLLTELPFLHGTESAAETKTSFRKGSCFKRKKTPSPLRHQVSKTTCGKVSVSDKQMGLRSLERADSGEVAWRVGLGGRLA